MDGYLWGGDGVGVGVGGLFIVEEGAKMEQTMTVW